MSMPLTTDQVSAGCWLSRHAREALLSAPHSAPGALLHDLSVPAAIRELRDNGLINSGHVLTARGARKHALLTEETAR